MTDGYARLAQSILENYICLACHNHYKKQDNSATCPHCGLTRREQAIKAGYIQEAKGGL